MLAKPCVRFIDLDVVVPRVVGAVEGVWLVVIGFGLALVLFFSATWFFLFEGEGLLKLLGIGTFAVGFAFTLFEILVAFLQAYIFTILTGVYIQLALAEEH